MPDVPVDMKQIANGFLDDVKSAFGGDLVSVILYGAAMRGEKAETPYISFLVVVGDNTPSELVSCEKYLKDWQKKKIAMPLFLTKEYIAHSLDTFPLEFMNMSSAYSVVYGEDVLDGLTFDDADIRNQCEREIKGKLLHLRAEYLALRSDTKGLVGLTARSLGTFRLVFLGALRLKGVTASEKTAAMLEKVTAEFNLDLSVFKKLTAVAGGELKLTAAEYDTLFDRYVEELDTLSRALDNWEREGDENA